MAKKKSSAILGILVCILLGVGLGFFLVWIKERLLGEMTEGALLLSLGVFILSLFAQVILHELGHLLFGLFTGYKFSSFRIFNFMWVKIDGKTRFKRLSLVGTAGQCLMLPPPLKEGKIPTVWYNLGGVIVNLFVSGVCIWLAFAFQGIPYLALCLVIFAAVGLILGLSNGIPLQVGQIDNDGKNALSLGKNKQAIYAFWLQLQVNGVLASGKRLRDMPEEWFEIPDKEELKNSMLATRGVFAENYLMDCRRFAEAKAVGELLLSPECGTLGVYVNLLRCDLAYIALVVDGNASAAQALWTKELVAFQKSMKNFPTVLRAQYAYALLLEKDEVKAAKILAQFEKVAKSYPYAADIQSERELLEIANQKKQEGAPVESATE